MAENQDIRENQMAVGSAQYLRGISGNGSSVRVNNIMNTLNKQSVTVDCNEMTDEGRYSANKWENSPYNSIGVLEVLRYSPDWIVQKFYVIWGDPEVYIRCWFSGNTWGTWRRI